jgi:excinuclease ABC subunit B
MRQFDLHSEFEPKADQVGAIDRLADSLAAGNRDQTLMGVTGSGKTFTMANIIARLQRPVLIISHNKTLAAQLYQEFRRFFPRNAVEYFVSYYDYYQPEAYIPATNTYIAKEATINDEIDRLRLCASNSLFARRDVIIVASVSCIYGIGAPETYYSMSFQLAKGQAVGRKTLAEALVNMQYQRQADEFKRGTFRLRGDIVDIFPAYADWAYRIELRENTVGGISSIDPLLGTVLDTFDDLVIHPRTFFSTPREVLEAAVTGIEAELSERLDILKRQGKIIEAERLEERTLYDVEMLREFGHCPGIENYSLYLSRRRPGDPPFTLLDYFPKDFLTIIDESHATVPQVGGMYHGDRSRKLTLIEHGFRLPSALDNRPLNFKEFESRTGQMLYVSATPGRYELAQAGKNIVEQIIRPTGLTDPEVEVRPVRGQVDDLKAEITARAQRNERTLVTTLTKKMAEDLTRYYHELGLRVRYLHAEVETLERVAILRDLRKGLFDALIGINLLREGLDLPEVSLVAILDADKEGFLRSATSLIQTFGRAARHVSGRAILYADAVTESMSQAMAETARRRGLQRAYNEAHGITPQSIVKRIEEVLTSVYERDYLDVSRLGEDKAALLSPEKRRERIESLEQLMRAASRNLEFEKAAKLRDELSELKKRELELGL